MIPALSISNLQKTYKGGFVALKGIDLEVAEGDFFALLGPNGAGKSTTIGIVSTLINKSEGNVRIFGHDINSDPVNAKRSLGLVPQEFNFNQFEPVEEILINQAGYYGIARAEATERTHYFLEKLGLYDKRRSESRRLSGGMKRRMMIARAMIHEPKMLILDEPTAGVDIEIRRSMWDYLREINDDGTTIILTTHYLEEAESLCRNIAIIDQGKIVRNSTMKELLSGLKRETFVLDIAQKLDKAPSFGEMDVTLRDETTLEIDVIKGTPINAVFCQLQEQGIEVISLRNKTNRLESLFIDLVEEGRKQA